MAQIPVRISARNHTNKRNRRCPENLITVKISKPGSPICNARSNTNTVSNHTNQNPNSYIPAILSAMVRAIASKVDEIQQIAELNSAGITICITETWLSANIPDSNVSIPGYNLFRQDRVHTTTGGGV